MVLLKQPERSTLTLWPSLGILPLWGGSGFAILCLLADGANPISACANTRKAGACHPSHDIFVKGRVESAVFLGFSLLEEIRPPLPRQLHRLLVAPLFDGAVVARCQDGRNFPAFPLLRPRIMRMFQQSAFKAFMQAGKIVAHHAGQDADDRIEHDQRRRLAAGQHVVTDRDFFQSACFDHPLVDALEAAADDNDAVACRKFAHALLRQRPAARAHQQARAGIVLTGAVDGAGENVGFEHHAGAAAGRRVVDGAVFIGGEIADLHRVQRPLPALHCLAGEGKAQMSRKHLRIECQHARPESHHFFFFGLSGVNFDSSSGSSTSPAASGSISSVPASRSISSTEASEKGISTGRLPGPLSSRRSPAPKSKTPVTVP
ncbi:hypothetical protein RHECNPAF_4460059 [Rhizobium etli CNPAF512]|nr:hypothetical protein RHECNPAF_4460059 [Rhizobium etli CNPAF512]